MTDPIIAQIAALVRLVGPDDWPPDAIPREPVVEAALQIRRRADEQRARVAELEAGLREALSWWRGHLSPEDEDITRLRALLDGRAP